MVRHLLRLDARGLDDRPPLLDLCLLKRGQCFRRLLLRRRDFEAEVGEPAADGPISKGSGNRSIEFADDRTGRAFRRPEAVPREHMESGQIGLVHRRDLGRRCQAAFACYSVSLDLPPAYDLNGASRGRAVKVDLASQQVVHRLRTAAVRYECPTGANLVLHVDSAEMRPAARPNVSLRDVVMVGLEPRDQSFEVVGWRGVLGQDQIWTAGNEGDRFEILQEIEGEAVNGAAVDELTLAAEDQRVAVRRRARHTAKSKSATGT